MEEEEQGYYTSLNANKTKQLRKLSFITLSSFIFSKLAMSQSILLVKLSEP
jgi:hypothetical protein